MLSPADKKSALAAMPALLPEAVEAHFARLGSDYWNAFSPEEIAAHVAALATLTAEAPWRVDARDLGDGLCGLTLIGGDFRGFFAAVSGFLASEGYDIRSGRVFSFPPDRALKALPRGGVLDFLVLRHEDPARDSNEERTRLRAEMENLFRRFGRDEGAAVRAELFRRIGARLETRGAEARSAARAASGMDAQNMQDVPEAPPPEIRVHSVHDATRLVIRASDREGALFCIAGALSLRGLSLVTLVTDSLGDGTFENTLTVSGPGGGPVRDARELEKIRVGVALMDRLLRALPGAVDVQAAAEGLQGLVEDWLEESADVFDASSRKHGLSGGAGGDFDLLSALSRVLTAGPRLWEAVDGMGPRAFRVLLAELAAETLPQESGIQRDTHRKALEELARETKLAKAATLARDSGASDPGMTGSGRDSLESITEIFGEALRAYRAREILKAELDLLLTPARDWRAFSARLTALAEGCLAAALDALEAALTARHGAPGAWALMAQGKFGGEELGSGSDLEITFVYGDEGDTAGVEPVRRGFFVEQLARELARLWAVPDGETFALDLRLRPHGESGPLAVSRAAWEAYYAKGGAALDYERQALVRLRPVHGDAALGEALCAARDTLAYVDPPRPIAETMALLARQAEAKAKTGKAGLWNAKLGPGGLAELEYGVQFLQLQNGRAHPVVRQGHWTRALEALLEIGAVTLAEFEHLYGANLFLRRLINALRLARGRSKDVYCPAAGTPEFGHLTRRMGYVARAGASAEEQLDRALKRARTIVASFYRYRFQDGPRPEWLYESLAETLMDPEATLEEAEPALTRLGMTDLPAARLLFLDLFDLLVEKRLMAACLLGAEGLFRRSPDPEGVLRRLIRYLRALDRPDLFIRQALHHPPLLEKLLRIFAGSDPLSELAVREGEGFKRLLEADSLEKPRLPDEFARLAAEALEDASLGPDAATRLCRLRNREYLRIALRDLHLSVPLREITYEISGLSDALIGAGLRAIVDQRAAESGSPTPTSFSILALGKLGGAELNYSSDIDLVFALGDAEAQAGLREAAEHVGRALIALLTRDTAEGRIFRVDMKLRPWGGQGPLVGSVSQYGAYMDTEADGWELQAWLKARVAAGDAASGRAVIARAQARACAPENAERIVASMRKVRLQGLDTLRRRSTQELHQSDLIAGEVKLGPGGIRTVEFYTQALQLRHAARIPELLTGNTLEALGRLNRYGLLPWGRFQMLAEAYVFLRRVEHLLQLQGLRQRHAMPTDPRELDGLARGMGYEDRVGRRARDQFLDTYRKHMLSLQPVSAELFGH